MAIYGIKDCANLQLFDLATGAPVIYTDYANVSTNEWSAERVYANAKGTRSIAWDYDRQGTLAVEMEVFDLGWLSILAGTEIIKGASEINKREVIKADELHKLTISGNAIAGTVAVVPVGSDLIEQIGEPLALVEDEPTTGQFKVEGKEIVLDDSVVAGTPYAVYYMEVGANAKTFEISAEKFPKSYRIVADALIRERETGVDEFVQITYPNARPQSNFTITMSATEPTNLSVTFDLFPNAEKQMAVYSIIGE